MENNKEMRIIGGKNKGKKILFLKNKNTRPLRDLVKENVFNLINHSLKINSNLKNLNIIDFYCGFGSFGIECLSREIGDVIFIEKNTEAIKILKENLKIFKSNNFKIIQSTVLDSIKKLSDNKFDLFFFDPPYKNDECEKVFNYIKKIKIFSKRNLIIIHRENKEPFISSEINIIFEKKYGRSKIIFGNFK